MSGGADPSSSKRSSKRRDEASRRLRDYIGDGPAAVTEEWAVGHEPKQGGKQDRKDQMKKKLKAWDQQWRKASS